MRRVKLCALATVLGAGVAVGQQPVPETGAHAPPGLAVQPHPQAANGRADEVDELKAAIARLQDRVDQLSATSVGKDDPPLEIAAPAGHTASTSTHLEEEPSWRLKWRNGLQFETLDEGFRVHVGGNMQFDAGWNGASQAVQFGPGGIGELQDGAVFRRARIRLDGTMYQHIEWVMQFDFANNVENDTSSGGTPIGSPSFSDVWIGLNDLPLIGTLRTGWMKEPIGFEHLTSSRYRNFMERPPGADSLGLHSPGIMLLNASPNQRVTWTLGFYHAQNGNFGFGSADGEYAETGRLTCLPWYLHDGYQLLHIGVGATHRHLANDQVDIHGRPSVRTMPGVLEPSLAETKTIAGDTQEVFDVELVGVFGPWTLQSEYYCTFIHDALFPNEPPPMGVPLGTLFYQGAYVEIMYFLTGEYQPYNRNEAVFDRVIPHRDFNVWGESSGWGAWQVGLRYSYLDLQNKGVNGATLHDMVLGLNWFLNPNMKIQWNLAFDHRDSTPAGSSGWTYIFGSRLALDF